MWDTRLVVTRTVDVGPERLFALLSRPAWHPGIDATNTLRRTDTERVTGVGDEFVMSMESDVLGDYETKNVVTVYEENRRIGWAPSVHPLDGYADRLGDVVATGHTYTWELEPAGEGRTTVTHTYDWSGVTDDAFRGFFPLISEEQLGDSIDNAARTAVRADF